MVVDTLFSQDTTDSPLVAAIDLGSNSFHMVLARLVQDDIQIVDKMGEKVQLAAGLDDQDHLSEEAIQRGLECMTRFAQRIAGMPKTAVKIVGTNALRAARNREEFILRAEEVMQHPIEVIAGREEARLIYLGAAHALADDKGRRLVIDIGGGSTEFIIGEHFEPMHLESLHMGCVSYNQRFFADGVISDKAFRRAVSAAQRELMTIRNQFRRVGWNSVIGSSGTIKSIEAISVAQGWTTEGITPEALQKLRKKVMTCKHISELKFEGLKPDRQHLLPAGLAILWATFFSLDITVMRKSDGALREGLLYDMLGRMHHEDIREQTVDVQMRRYHVDRRQAARVENSALIALAQVKQHWKLLDEEEFHSLLSWAARVHEMGLAIAHSNFHKHGAYILENADLAGFTKQEQMALASLVRCHRRKISKSVFESLPGNYREACFKLCLLLRLSVLLHRNRNKQRQPAFTLSVDGNKVTVSFPVGWLDSRPLTRDELTEEASYWRDAGMVLEIA
ncbi:exopolyphosphatase [Pokkaliibacter sp. MBI-7]|uniref:exopolyphosphatase n=1 Tax=Pokkaliibacter sp. MBI-7 TaxID=3040600 RepID=UPI00244C8769|nr:exopolyphosphatase [Pokkaliibacter sp. MBI-7]MDH2432107.1 exopolyphosphatase [Pokkaliibacter sp. MBI-7]